MELSPGDIRILQAYRRDLAYHNAFHPLELLELHTTGKTRGIKIPSYVSPLAYVLDRAYTYDDFLWDEGSLISAIITHDVVYNPGAPKGENEQASFNKWVEIVGHNPGLLLEPLVMATATHHPDSVEVHNENHRILVAHMIDLDMSTLGADREEFDRNSANIVQEFMTIGYTAEQCHAGRLKFYESVLKQDRIYFTPQFYDTLEAKARQNMIEDIDAGMKKTMLVDTPGGPKTADIIDGKPVIVQG